MIELKNVGFSYPGQDNGGLRNINLTIQDGECILLCGRSGCGKTTVTRLLNGLIPKFYAGELTGTVAVDGRNISDLPMYRISEHIGSVFQNPRTQFFNTDSDSEIAFGLENEGRPQEELRLRVETVSRDLGLKQLRGCSLHRLSGGEKQKIAFASVYAMNPDIYLLDEPSSNLDRDAIRDLKEYLKRIRKQGKTILIAEHRLYYLMDVADRVIYMEQGEIKGIYTPEAFRKIPSDERERMGLRSVDLQKVHPRTVSVTTPEAVFSIRDAGIYYKKKVIAENINLSAGAGEVIGIVGHNGSGKTTFSRTLCGLHKEERGQFLWKGRQEEQRSRLKRSYMVMQDVNFQLFADSVCSECSFGIRNPDPELVRAVMDKLGLLPFKDHHPNTLSGGQKQRVAVAVSMICGKELLVFDEPTSGLDYDSMTQVAGLIRELAGMGKIIFVVTHDYEFVCRTCTRVFNIAHGEPCSDIPVSTETEKQLKKPFFEPN